jgi:hypothetical protein
LPPQRVAAMVGGQFPLTITNLAAAEPPPPLPLELPEEAGPEEAGPEEAGPEVDGPVAEGPGFDGPELDGPGLDGPELDGPGLEGPVLEDVERPPLLPLLWAKDEEAEPASTVSVTAAMRPVWRRNVLYMAFSFGVGDIGTFRSVPWACCRMTAEA